MEKRTDLPRDFRADEVRASTVPLLDEPVPRSHSCGLRDSVHRHRPADASSAAFTTDRPATSKARAPDATGDSMDAGPLES
jgi:hypothetical protein